MEGGQIVFRVHGDGAAMDWTVQPDAVTFRDVLVSSILHPLDTPKCSCAIIRNRVN